MPTYLIINTLHPAISVMPVWPFVSVIPALIGHLPRNVIPGQAGNDEKVGRSSRE